MSYFRLLSKWLIVTLLLSFSSASFAARHADLETIAPIQIPQGKTEKEIKEAIYLGAVARNWTLKELAPNLIEATVNVRNKHTLVVDVKYDAQQIVVSYKSSINLDYEVVDGKAIIHKNANSWMKNLTLDISKFLNR